MMPEFKVPIERGGIMENGPLTKEHVDEKARHLLARMSLKEKIQQMSGSTPPFPGLFEVWLAYNMRPLPAGENAQLSVPAICFSDGPRGVVMNHCTCFPVSMARGASWDTALEERIGDAMGVEARSLGANFMGSVCINLLRHPAWGRAQETYGEDPCLLGEMGAALVRGIQRHAMACIKHFAANSIENSRFHGYRLMDKRGDVPAFHFGFGLSYTTFAYKNLQIDRSEIGPDEALKISVDVTNTGNVVGGEVVQLYIGYNGSRVERPIKELKGFSKADLGPGQTKRVDFLLPAKQLAYYDEQQARWIVEPLTYSVHAGPSSKTEDLLSTKFRVRAKL